MPASSDSQKSRDAQLRRAFQKHLPRRIAGVQRRLRALAQNAWDINTLHLLYIEIQQLAGSSGKYGIVEASEKLSAMEVVLHGYLSADTMPDPDQSDELMRMVEELDSVSGGADLEELSTTAPTVVSKIIATASLPEPDISPSGLPSTDNVPTLIRPPAEFLPYDVNQAKPFHNLASNIEEQPDEPVSQFDDPELERLAEANVNLELGDIADRIITGDEQFEVLESDELSANWKEEAKPQKSGKADSADQAGEKPGDQKADGAGAPDRESATAATDRDPRQPTLYYLHRSTDYSEDLATRLAEIYDVESLDDVEKFRETLSAMGPDAVLIDGVFIDEIENLGPLVRTIRRKQNSPMPMLAFSEATDITQRLKILRAGADAFLKSDTPPDDVLDRLQELMRGPESDPYRILIVEDDRSQAMFAESILRKAGMEVRLERNPMKVLEQLESFVPELILMDLYMPDCDGMELTSIIRERDDFINTPIVFLSGESDTDKHFDALLAGGDDFLSKPIRPRHLIQAVTNRVQRARALARRRLAQPGSAETDTVTGLTDRPQLLEAINKLLADHEKLSPEKPGGVLFLEIDQPFELRQRLGLDGFESLTDQLGPMFATQLGKNDMATRYGDNAYCMLLPERRPSILEDQAKAFSTAVSEHMFNINGTSAAATVSIGVCQLSSQFADAGALISAAERACNQGYMEGVSRIMVHELAHDFNEETDDAVAMTIAAALENDDLQILYQPIVSLRGASDEQYQALVRVIGDDGAPIPASRLIPAAEQHGHIRSIDAWVLNRALGVIDERQRNSRPLRLFVNQSVQSLSDAEVLPKLYKQLQTRGVDPKWLVLEFKLPEIVNRLRAAVVFSKRLRSIGVSVCLGAFDGSATAFKALNHLEVDYIKLPASDEQKIIGQDVANVIQRLHQLDKLAIIPAIEDAQTAAKLWQTGVDFIQGYFVQRPEAELEYQFRESQM